LDELLPPDQAVRFDPLEIGSREPTAAPVTLEDASTEIGEAETPKPNFSGILSVFSS
jgi:hypothetical protein